MTLTQLRYFCEVAKCQSFTLAAKNLYVSQSSMSITIKELENELDLPLFIRKGKQTALSVYGEELYPSVYQALTVLDEGIQKAKTHIDSNVVRIGCFVNTSHAMIPWFLNGFPINDCRIQLDVQQTFVDMFPDLLNGKYDLLLTTNGDSVRFCESREIALQAIYLLLPVTHKFAFRKSITIPELKDEQLLFVAPNCYMDVHIKQAFAAHNLVPNMQYASDYSTLALDIALGRGIALTTKMPVDDKILSYVPLDDPMSLRSVYLSWPTNRKLSTATSEIIKYFLTTSETHGSKNLIF